MPRIHTARCACGTVEIAFHGAPISTVSCCCDDCQEAGAQLEALPGATPYREACGGTPAGQFHKKALRVVKGADRLAPHRLREGSRTYRMVASCCNSAMYIGFDRGPFWVTPFLARFDDMPPPEFRIMTKFLVTPPPGDVPNYATYPTGLGLRVTWALLTGLFRRAA